MLENLIPLDPIHFFAIQVDVFQVQGEGRLSKQHSLPALGHAHAYTLSAGCRLGWQQRGLNLEFEIEGRFNQPEFPDITKGDSIELFIDTRDIKTAGQTHRYCHHFFFLPVALLWEEKRIHAGEKTRFRTEDRHELCEGSLLQVAMKEKRRETQVAIFIPSECLYGYDPMQFGRLGFTYRINRRSGLQHHFAVNSSDFAIENNPSLWASIYLCP